MDTQAYLARINYVGKTDPTFMMLAALQKAHLLTVPFENLDIHAGVRIVLDPARLYRKIVTMKRGGFCYELNAMFHWLLRQLGFDARLLMGRVYDQISKDFGPEFDHMLMQVTTQGRAWIVDVGFGDFSMGPLEFLVDQPLQDTNGRFLIEQDVDGYFRISRFSERENRYSPEYKFSPNEKCLEDFAAMCTYHQTSPQSHFTQRKVCSVATLTGRMTLTDDKLIITDRGKRTEMPVGNNKDFDQALARYFDITLSKSPL